MPFAGVTQQFSISTVFKTSIPFRASFDTRKRRSRGDIYMQQIDPETYSAVLKLESLVSGHGTNTNNADEAGH